MSQRVRLDKLLANLGYGSRREVQRIIRSGAVVLNGETLVEPEGKVELRADLPLLVEGEPLEPIGPLLLVMNKPTGYSCSHKEDGELVYDLLPPRWLQRQPPLSTVGRLDKETSGLLLLTDDGALLHRIIAPKSEIKKRYRARLARDLGGGEAEVFGSGSLLLEGENKPLLPASLEMIGPREAVVTISEGRYHQVRRMFAAVGNHVEELHREAMGKLELPEDLAPGEFRILQEAERASLFA